MITTSSFENRLFSHENYWGLRSYENENEQTIKEEVEKVQAAIESGKDNRSFYTEILRFSCVELFKEILTRKERYVYEWASTFHVKRGHRAIVLRDLGIMFFFENHRLSLFGKHEKELELGFFIDEKKPKEIDCHISVRNNSKIPDTVLELINIHKNLFRKCRREGASLLPEKLSRMEVGDIIDRDELTKLNLKFPPHYFYHYKEKECILVALERDKTKAVKVEIHSIQNNEIIYYLGEKLLKASFDDVLYRFIFSDEDNDASFFDEHIVLDYTLHPEKLEEFISKSDLRFYSKGELTSEIIPAKSSSLFLMHEKAPYKIGEKVAIREDEKLRVGKIVNVEDKVISVDFLEDIFTYSIEHFEKIVAKRTAYHEHSIFDKNLIDIKYLAEHIKRSLANFNRVLKLNNCSKSYEVQIDSISQQILCKKHQVVLPIVKVDAVGEKQHALKSHRHFVELKINENKQVVYSAKKEMPDETKKLLSLVCFFLNDSVTEQVYSSSNKKIAFDRVKIFQITRTLESKLKDLNDENNLIFLPFKAMIEENAKRATVA